MKANLIDLRAEWKELAQKMDKVGTYIEGEEFKSLPIYEQRHIEMLYLGMREYLSTIVDVIIYESTPPKDYALLGTAIESEHGN